MDEEPTGPIPRARRRRRLSLELKYATFAVVVVAVMVVLHLSNAFSDVNDTVTEGVDRLAQLGSVGFFLIALVANVSILIQIPYTLPLLSAALSGASLQSMLVLGLASGLGAGIGAVLSYKVADALVARTPGLPEGRVFRWIARNVDTRPRASRFVIFLVAASPLPDGTVVVPLAVVGYGMRRLAAPLFLGKLVHNLLLALLFSWVGSWASEHVSKKASTDLAVAVAVLFMLLVAYHAEKARHLARNRTGDPIVDETPA
ncbi:MAG: hypothetical protein U0W40_07180 [Acidimicrobiia bacterium]